MDIKTIIEHMCSEDGDLIYNASREIIRTADRKALDILSHHVSKFVTVQSPKRVEGGTSASTRSTDGRSERLPKFSEKYTSRYPDHHGIRAGVRALAMDIILNHNKHCRCFLYSKPQGTVGNFSPNFSPEVEEKLGNIYIVHEEADFELYEIRFDITCSNCGKKYRVRQNDDRFYPIWQWKIV